MRIYFFRHGKDNDRYRGGWANLGLIKEGEVQADRLAFFLSGNSEEYPISKIISSDLKRSMETAEIVSKRLGMKVFSSVEWREMNNGDLAGMLNSEALNKYPGLFFNTLKIDERYPGGESPIEFFNRIRDSFLSIIEKPGNDSVAVFTHFGVINYYLLYC